MNGVKREGDGQSNLIERHLRQSHIRTANFLFPFEKTRYTFYLQRQLVTSHVAQNNINKIRPFDKQ